MKAIRTLLILLIFFGITGPARSKSITGQQAALVAVHAWSEKAGQGAPGDRSAVLSETYAVRSDGTPVYYVFNISGNRGFIIIAADDRVPPVLGWSQQGHYRENGHPPAFDQFMRGLELQVKLAVREEERSAAGVSSEWERYLDPGFVPLTVKDVGPLIQTTWDQGCFYNEQCPADPNAGSNCFHALTGCGATSMAQILKYWAYPQHGTGSYGYDHPVYGYLFADFSAATYNYSAMPSALTSGNPEAARLVYHCGVAQAMDYGVTSSVSDVLVIDDAFRDYFDYNPALDWKVRSDYASGTWESMVRAELDAGRPLLYYGNDNGAVGHAFICDGYQGTSFFHFNWGWSGTYDGYFYLSDITPGSSNYSDNQRALFDLRPAQMPASFAMDFESVPDFSITFSPWTVADLDLSLTYGIENYTFPHATEPMAFIAFNPAQVTPSMSGDVEIQPHGGSRFGACFSATTPPNNDWFISPQVQMNYNGNFSFWVKSYTADYGLEKYKVAVSTTGNDPADFTVISGPTALEAPTDWTKVTFDLTEYNGQQIYIGIHCISNDAFIFMIDDLEVDPGSTGSLIADFSADATTIAQGQSVSFTDISVGNPTTWQWTFQGGVPGTSTAADPPNIRYDNPGIYDVTLTIGDGTNTDTKTKSGYITVTQAYPSQMTLDFEGLSDFTTLFLPWTTVDVNGGLTYTIGGTSFPGDGEPMAWISFNPTATTPPLSGVTAHSGVRTGACFSSQPTWNPNNKWLITPKMQLGDNGKIELWVRSFNAEYGLESYNICVSQTGNQPADFSVVSGINPVEAPVNWVKHTYSLADFSGKQVYLGIQCVSDNVYFMMIDDISVTSTVGINEKAAAAISVYPNPASDCFYVKFADAPDAFTADLFDALGSKVSTVHINGAGNVPAKIDVGTLPDGVYFLRLTYRTSTVTKKIIVVE